MQINVPTGMTRRHFLNHALTSAAAVPALEFLLHLEANAATVRKNQKACILLWLGGGPPTIDMWDMKPGSKNGGEFKPITTSAGYEISRASAEDGQNRLEALDRPLDEHARGRPRPRPLLPAHGLRPEPDGGPPVVRVGRQPRAGTQAAVARNPRLHFHRRRRAKGRAFWEWPTPPSWSTAAARSAMPRSTSSTPNASTIACRCSTSSRRASSIPSGATLRRPTSDIYKKAVNLMTSKQMAAFRLQEEKPEVLHRLRQQQFRPRPRDGPPPGRNRRAVRRSHARRLGPAPTGLRRTENAAPAQSRPGLCRPWSPIWPPAACWSTP